MGNALRGVAVFVAAIGLAGCTTQPAQQSLGKLGGEIRLSSTDSAVAAYMAAHPAVSVDSTVKVYARDTTAVAATTTPTLSNTAPSSSVWLAGSYAIRPPVDPAGTKFLVEVASLYLNGGGWYRFGTRWQDTQSAQESPPVLPETPGDAGTTKDVDECAVMASVKPKLVDAPDDAGAVGALDPNAQVSCIVISSVFEGGGSAGFSTQAGSTPAPMTLAQARNGEVTVSFPIRSFRADPANGVTGARTTFAVACSTVPPAGSNFAVDASGRANFGSVSGEGVYSCPTSTGGANNPGTVSIDVPVKRNAGNVVGLFDLVGYTESAAGVWVNTPTQFRTTTPSPLPSNQPNPSSWRIDGVQAGIVTSLQAAGAVTGSSMGIRLPVVNPNRPEILANRDISLGSTFVVQPLEVPGRVLLLDRFRRTRLDTLTNAPPVDWNGSASSSYVQAVGDQDPLQGEASSSSGGSSVGRLDGALPQNNPCRQFTLGCTLLDYRLLLSGISPIDGPTDGSRTARTAWDVNSMHLLFADPATSHRQSLSMNLRYERRYYSKAPTQVPPGGITEIGACFGQVEIDMRVDTNTGDLYQPSFNTTGPVAAINTNAVLMQPSDISSAFTTASGRPGAEADAGSVATVTAVMPEGASYLLQPSVRFKPRSGGASTQVSGLPQVRLPATGTLACSQVVRACIKVNDAGASSPVMVTFGAQPLCPAAGSSTLPITVEGGNDTIQQVSYSIDGVAQPDLCNGNCGTTFNGSIPLALAAGDHTIVATASTSNGCQASNSYSLTIPTETPSLQCPANFTVIAGPGESSIPADDARIAGRLVAQATGSCAAQPSGATDNRPASFPLGATPVQFSLPGAPSCSTTVTVARSKKQVAFFDINRLRLYRMEDDQFHWSVTPQGGAGPIVFNAAGTKLAVRTAGQVMILNADTGATELVESGAFTDYAFRPGTADDRAGVQFVGQGFPYALSLKIGGAVQSFIVPDAMAGQASAPRVAWSDDGLRVAVVFTYDTVIAVREWNLSGQQVTLGRQDTVFVPPGQRVLGVTYERYVTGGHLLIATNERMYRTRATGQMQVLHDIPVNSIDLHRTAPAAIDLGQNEPYFVATAEAYFLPTQVPGTFLPWGPVKGVAASDFPITLSPNSDPAIAVALTEYVVPGQRRQFVVLYRLGPAATPGGNTGTLVIERKIPAQEPAFPAFRPYLP